MRCLKALQPDPSALVVAHFNHRLRGEDSQADQTFVEQLSREVGLQCIVGQGKSQQTRDWTEVAEAEARQQRYDFLITTAQQIGARYIATGHTADDQAETVLHHVLRGTGLAGLAGIPRIRRASEAVTIVRPLLSVRRPTILEYLGRLNQGFRHDATNDHHSFTRNRIRHELIPHLRQDYNEEVTEALLRLSQIAAESQSLLRELAARLLDDSRLSQSESAVRLSTAPLEKASQHMRRESFVVLWQQQHWPLQSMSFAHWQDLAQLVADSEQNGTLNLPGNIVVRRFESELTFTRATTV
jgi:tRNA(Ile)-lysidine synthase